MRNTLSTSLLLWQLFTVATGSAVPARRQHKQTQLPADANYGLPILPTVQNPKAKVAQDICPGYKAENVQKSHDGLSATLKLAGKPCNAYGTDIHELKLTIESQDEHRLSVNIQPAHITDENYSHYILPDSLVPKPKAGPESSSNGRSDLQYKWGNSPSFWFQVVRQSTGDVIFDTKGTTLVYENQFIEFVTALPDDYYLSGLGERMHGITLNENITDHVATIFASDAGDVLDENIYGSHSFYLEQRFKPINGDSDSESESEYENIAHGVWLRNAHGQEILFGSNNITWRTLGGSIDLYFFDGPSPADVTRQYQTGAVGLPAMQQYWTFGYHQCRWGYRNWTQLEEVVANMKRFNIPLETIWSDIDYMKEYRDFTTDPNTFPVPEGQKFIGKLHKNNQHYVPIIDSAIYIPNPHNDSDAYATWERGNKEDIFTRNPDGSKYIGAVWPGFTQFPDWMNGKAVSWWVDEVSRWYQDIPFDGIWIDMSEVSSFCVGSCGSGQLEKNPIKPNFLLPGDPDYLVLEYPEGFKKTNYTEWKSASSASSVQSKHTATPTPTTKPDYFITTPTPGVRDINWPPYAIKNIQGDLAAHAMAMNATHSNGMVEYDVHNLFGYQILNATYAALQNVFPGKRPFIIGRSTFAGSGRSAGHWGGDNNSVWPNMFLSIPQALSFALYGIPMFGVDTCGFNRNTDMELCNRWMQLSAFFPFYRNHNILGANSQEPYVWSSVAEASKKAMHIRYSLLPYMYTLFHHAHTKGDTVMRALSWEFPSPRLARVDRQFLLGPAIMVTPVLDQGADKVKGYFPGSTSKPWYDWYTQQAVPKSYYSKNATLDAPLGHIPVHIRGGYILPTQEPGYTTAESRSNPWGLIVALDGSGSASGDLYVDDGESEVPKDTTSVVFKAQGGKLTAKVTGGYEMEGKPTPLADVTIMGVKKAGVVKLNGKKLSSSSAKFDSEKQLLKLSGLNELTKQGAWKDSWTLEWE